MARRWRSPCRLPCFLGQYVRQSTQEGRSRFMEQQGTVALPPVLLLWPNFVRDSTVEACLPWFAAVQFLPWHRGVCVRMFPNIRVFARAAAFKTSAWWANHSDFAKEASRDEDSFYKGFSPHHQRCFLTQREKADGRKKRVPPPPKLRGPHQPQLRGGSPRSRRRMNASPSTTHPSAP